MFHFLVPTQLENTFNFKQLKWLLFLFLFFLFSLSHKDEFTIIPVLVGALSESKEQEFGKLFSKYLADPSNLFVVSSDFCHWGKS